MRITAYVSATPPCPYCATAARIKPNQPLPVLQRRSINGADPPLSITFSSFIQDSLALFARQNMVRSPNLIHLYRRWPEWKLQFVINLCSSGGSDVPNGITFALLVADRRRRSPN